MKQILVIGSSVIDVILKVPFLPARGDDVNVLSAQYRLGGCAYNVYKALALFESPARLCSPVGYGIFGRMVREYFHKEGLHPLTSLEYENGCCYCLIEPDGERTFISHHGAEYLFSRSWMKNVNYSETDGMFLCGIDVEEPTGDEMVEYAYEHPELALYFSPGPRIMHIPQKRLDRLLERRDAEGKGLFLHLNLKEALDFSAKDSCEEAAEALAARTRNSVVITLGERGCYCLLGAGLKGSYVPGIPSQVVDTVGAGDAHCGAVIACIRAGKNLEDSCRTANKIGAAVISKESAVLDTLPAGFEV